MTNSRGPKFVTIIPFFIIHKEMYYGVRGLAAPEKNQKNGHPTNLKSLTVVELESSKRL